jgi:RNA polymerase sigma-70 factor (ECF subfamily)
MFRVQDGDLDKMGPLFEKYHKIMFNHFLLQTNSEQLSEDLVQELFYRILKYRHTYRGEGKFTTWMFAIAHNVRIEHFRKNGKKTEPLDVTDRISSEDPTPDEILDRYHEKELIRKALLKLSEEKREVLILSRFQDKKYEEIAEITGSNIGTIKSRVYWALRDLSRIYRTMTRGEIL